MCKRPTQSAFKLCIQAKDELTEATKPITRAESCASRKLEQCIEVFYHGRNSCLKTSVPTDERSNCDSHPLPIEHDSKEEARQALEYEILRAAKNKYEEHTWRMYDRIMRARKARLLQSCYQVNFSSRDPTLRVNNIYHFQVHPCMYDCNVSLVSPTLEGLSYEGEEGIFPLDL